MADYSFIPVKTTDIPEEGAMTAVKEFLVNTETEQTRVILKGGRKISCKSDNQRFRRDGGNRKGRIEYLKHLKHLKGCR